MSIMALAVPAAANAATATWDGDIAAINSSWSLAANWVGDTLPAPGDDVVIPGFVGMGNDVVVTGVPSISLSSFTVLDAGATDNVQQIVAGAPGAAVTITDTLSVHGGMFSSIGLILAGSVQSAVLADGSDEAFSIDGTGLNSSVASGATLELATSGMLRFNELNVASGGLVYVTGGPTFDSTSSVLNGPAVLVADNATISFTGGSIAGTSAEFTGTTQGYVNLDGVTLSSVNFGVLGVNVSGAVSTVSIGSTVAFGGMVTIRDTLLNLLDTSTIHVRANSYVNIPVDTTPVGFVASGATTTILNEGSISFEAVDPVTAGSGALEADVTSSGGSAGLSIIGTFPVSTGGADITSDKGDISFESGSPTLNAGTITSSDVSGTDSAFIFGTGTINATTIIGSGGVIVPDRAVGPALTFSSLDMQAGSRLESYLMSDTVYGHIAADGVMNGEVTVAPAGFYSPAVGTTFVVRSTVTGGAPADTFASVDSRQIGNGLWMSQSAASSQLTLTTRQAILASSAGGFPGGSITLTGTGFAPGETVTIDLFGDSAGHAQAQITPDGSGGFATVVPISPSFKAEGFGAYAYGSVSGTNVIARGILTAAPTCAIGQTGTPPNCVTPTTPAPGGLTGTQTPGADTLVGGAGDDTASGGAGADTFAGNAGNDTFYGGAGSDSGFGGIGDDTLIGGFGDDRLVGGDGADRVVGGRGADRLFGSSGPDTVNGGDGSDVVRGGRGADRIFCGGSGVDVATGDNGMDIIGCRDGSAGDVLSGGFGLDTCIGDRGDRFLSCEIVLRR